MLTDEWASGSRTTWLEVSASFEPDNIIDILVTARSKIPSSAYNYALLAYDFLAGTLATRQ